MKFWSSPRREADVKICLVCTLSDAFYRVFADDTEVVVRSLSGEGGGGFPMDSPHMVLRTISECIRSRRGRSQMRQIVVGTSGLNLRVLGLRRTAPRPNLRQLIPV